MKKIIAALSALVVVLGMTACGNSDEPQGGNDVPEVTTAVETTAHVTEIPPAERITSEITDWSLEDLAKEITINGKKLSLPFAMNELGEGYTMMGTDRVIDGYDGMIMELNYNGNYLADIWADKFDDGMKVIGIQASAINLSDFKIGDISFESTKEEIEAKYGKSNYDPGFETDLTAMYAFLAEDGETVNNLVLMYDKENNYKVSAMQVYLNNGGVSRLPVRA